MKKAIGRKQYSLEQLITLLTEIEAVLNSRPLTYVYEEFNLGFTLTPSHFLTGYCDGIVMIINAHAQWAYADVIQS